MVWDLTTLQILAAGFWNFSAKAIWDPDFVWLQPRAIENIL